MTVPPPAGGFRKDDEVLLSGKWWRLSGAGPATGSWVATTAAGDLSVLYRDELQGVAWKRFGYGDPTRSELPAAKRPEAACRCPIKDLTSVGHTDPQCPERKQKK